MWKPRIVLHIGIHKTGTSSIQSYFFDNRADILEDCGILYPESALLGINHNPLAWQFLSIPEYESYRQQLTDLIGKLQEEIHQKDSRRVFISGEDISLIEEPRDFLAIFKNCRVKVLLFLRRQDDFLNSVFNQDVKSQEFQRTGSIEDLLEEPKFRNLMDYAVLCRRWEAAVGKTNMYVYLAETSNPRAVFERVFQILRLRRVNKLDVSEIKKNVSLPRDAAELFRIINELKLPAIKRQVILDYIEKFLTSAQKVDYVASDLRSKLEEQYSSGNRAVFDRYVRNKAGNQHFHSFSNTGPHTVQSHSHGLRDQEILKRLVTPLIQYLWLETARRHELCQEQLKWIRHLEKEICEENGVVVGGVGVPQETLPAKFTGRDVRLGRPPESDISISPKDSAGFILLHDALPTIKELIDTVVGLDDILSRQAKAINTLEQKRRESSLAVKTLYIHAGRAKTGTSALQRFFVTNEHRLRRMGLQYADTGRFYGTHHPLIWSIHRELYEKTQKAAYWNRCRRYAVLDRTTHEYFSQLRQEVLSSPGPNFLVSSEEMTVVMDSWRVIPLLRRYLGNHCRIRIVVYLRRQDEFLESVYNEAVKGYEWRTAVPFEKLTQPIIEVGSLDYYGLIKLWADNFGRDNIIIRIYDKKVFRPHIFADFLDALGMEFRDEYVLPEGDINPSLTRPEIWFMRRRNRKPYDREYHSELLRFMLRRRRVRRNLGSVSLIGNKRAREIMRLCKESNDRLAREYLGRETLFGEPFHGRRMHALADILIFTKLEFEYYLKRLRIRLKNWPISHRHLVPLSSRSEQTRTPRARKTPPAQSRNDEACRG